MLPKLHVWLKRLQIVGRSLARTSGTHVSFLFISGHAPVIVSGRLNRTCMHVASINRCWFMLTTDGLRDCVAPWCVISRQSNATARHMRQRHWQSRPYFSIALAALTAVRKCQPHHAPKRVYKDAIQYVETTYVYKRSFLRIISIHRCLGRPYNKKKERKCRIPKRSHSAGEWSWPTYPSFW